MNLVINELYDLSDESESEENLRYDDFFTTKSSSKQLRSNSDSDSASDQEIRDSDDSDLEDESENGNGQPVSQADAMTTHAKERQKLQNRIAEFESQLLEPKSWERKGEVMSGDRPENSLLGLAVAVERYLMIFFLLILHQSFKICTNNHT